MHQFRLLTPDDYPLLLEWLARPHVREWWDEGEDTLEKVAENYGPEEDLERFLLIEETEKGQRPIGFFQYYILPDRSVGIDQFIGEADRIDRGVGARAVRTFIELIARKHSPERIILDPQPENKRAIRCYEKVGFVHYETKIGEDGRMAYMMEFRRGESEKVWK
ncbi:MAG: GNAT family N-acetyltransferase [Pyrinomonadaceae bacterium]